MPSKGLIIRSHITEKAHRAKAENKYVFVVAKRANKSEIKKLVKKTYKVDVIGVSITNTGNLKKAIVALKPGQTINEKV